jgi:hypothetical protein
VPVDPYGEGHATVVHGAGRAAGDDRLPVHVLPVVDQPQCAVLDLAVAPACLAHLADRGDVSEVGADVEADPGLDRSIPVVQHGQPFQEYATADGPLPNDGKFRVDIMGGLTRNQKEANLVVL